MMWLGILTAILALLVCGIINLFPFNLEEKSKKERNVKITLYLIINLILVANMFFVMTNFKNISNEFIGKVLLFFSTLYFIVIIYGSVIMLFRNIIILIFKLLKKDNICKILKSRRITAIVLIGLGVFDVIGYINEGIIVTTDYSVEVNKTADKNEYKMVVLSDSHLGAGNSKGEFDTVVNKVNDMDADFIFLVGDMVDENTSDENAKYMVDSVEKMKSKYGIYCVYGNHEGYGRHNLRELFENSKVTVLEDDVSTIEGINIVGRNDYHENPLSIQELFNEKNVDTSKPTVVLSHEPKEYDILKDNNVDLVLSGHTHGHQLLGCYPFLALANDMVYGHEKRGDMNAIVSAGTGNWGIHFTLPQHNEIVEINFKLDK